MINEIVGYVHRIGVTQTLPSKNGGNDFRKRELIVVQHRYNQDTGEPLADNYILLETTQGKCDELDKFNVGDRVRVAFVIEGRPYIKPNTQEERYFNSLRAFRIEKAAIPQQAPQQTQQPMQQVAPPQYEPQVQTAAPQQVAQENTDALPF